MPTVATGFDRASYVFEKFFAGNHTFKRRQHEFVDEFYRPYENVDSFYRFGVCVDNFIRSDWKRAAREVTVPTFVACGRFDDRTHHSSSALVAAHIASSAIDIDEAGDHYEFCRAKPYLIEKLTTFLSNA
jgi:pimeloyl-ACP methyl ester carboxylesterase